MAADALRVTYASQCKLLTGAKKALPHLKDPYSQVLQQVLQQSSRSLEPLISRPKPHGHPLGIDLGLDSFVATSDHELIDRPRFFIESQHKAECLRGKLLPQNLLLKLRNFRDESFAPKHSALNRDISRKQKGSKNQQKARVKVIMLYEKIHNTRKHFHISVAHHLCDQAGMIFAAVVSGEEFVRKQQYEELNLKALAKGMLGKHCLDAGWGSFLNILGWVAFKRGVYFAKFDSRGTSQLCLMCDTRVFKDLSVQVHECSCGYRTNRDVASGQIVCNRGLAAVGQTVKKPVEDGEETNPLMRQELSRAILGSRCAYALSV